MTFALLLIAASFELGLTFPAGGLEKEVNIGEYLRLSHSIIELKSVVFSPYVRFSRYPGITSALPVYDGSAGMLAGFTKKIAGISGELGLGFGVLQSSNNIVHVESYFIMKRRIIRDINLDLAVSIPILFFENTTIYSVNIGLFWGI